MERFNNNLIIIILLIILAVIMYWWINRIDDMYQRVIGILAVAIVSYFIGRLHGEKIIKCNQNSQSP